MTKTRRLILKGYVHAMRERYLVTGANGCIGAWTVKLLLADDCDVISFDLGADEHRHRLINSGQLPDIEWCQGDITDPQAVAEAVARCDRIIHLAALQVPFCRADPSRGAEVNVKGTVNVFEAALAHDVPHLVQASSIAVYGANNDYPNPIVPADAPRLPRTLYGVYKTACEDLARIYWWDHELSSTALRPHTVHGPGRDQGMTSQPTVAVERAARGESFTVEYGGSLGFQYAPDIAQAFIEASRRPTQAAPAFNLPADTMQVRSFLDLVTDITGIELSCGDDGLDLVDEGAADTWIEWITEWSTTPLVDAIRESIDIFSTQN